MDNTKTKPYGDPETTITDPGGHRWDKPNIRPGDCYPFDGLLMKFEEAYRDGPPGVFHRMCNTCDGTPSHGLDTACVQCGGHGFALIFRIERDDHPVHDFGGS